MNRFTKCFAGIVMSASFAAAMSMMAFAQDISHINVTFSGEQPYEGNSISEINVSSSGSNYFARVAGYTNDEDTWDRGDTPVVNVELYTEGDGNRFTCSGSSHFSLHGMGASYRSAHIDDNGTHMQLVVTLSRVAGDEELDVADNLWWDGRSAHWDKIDGVDKYQVQLYRDDHKVTTITTDSRHHNFSDNMDREGSYYFRVRGEDGSNKGGWSDWSDDYDVDRTRDDDNSSGHSSSCPSYAPGSKAAGWQHDAAGYWYQNSDGSYPHNAWIQVGGKWYFFNSKGYRVSGWVQWKGVYYYLGSDGAMYVNATTPDGYYVDGNGVWNQSAGRGSVATNVITPNSPGSTSTSENHHVTGFNGGPGV